MFYCASARIGCWDASMGKLTFSCVRARCENCVGGSLEITEVLRRREGLKI